VPPPPRSRSNGSLRALPSRGSRAAGQRVHGVVLQPGPGAHPQHDERGRRRRRPLPQLSGAAVRGAHHLCPAGVGIFHTRTHPLTSLPPWPPPLPTPRPLSRASFGGGHGSGVVTGTHRACVVRHTVLCRLDRRTSSATFAGGEGCSASISLRVLCLRYHLPSLSPHSAVLTLLVARRPPLRPPQCPADMAALGSASPAFLLRVPRVLCCGQQRKAL
jgi:hypothetical protein